MRIPRARILRAACGALLVLASLTATLAAAPQTRWLGAFVCHLDSSTVTMAENGVPVTLFRYRGNPGDDLIVTLTALETEDGVRRRKFPRDLRVRYLSGGDKGEWKTGPDDEDVKGFRVTLPSDQQEFAVVPAKDKLVQTFRVEVEVVTTAPQPLLLRWDYVKEERLDVNRMNFYDLPIKEGDVCEFEVRTYNHTPTFRIEQGGQSVPFTVLKSKPGEGMIRVAFPRTGSSRLFVGGFRDGEYTHYTLFTWSALRLKRD